MRGDGTIYRQKGSRFWWMSYWQNGQRHQKSTGCDKPKPARDVLRGITDLLRRSFASPAAPQVLVSDLYESLERDYVINDRKSLSNLKIRWRKHLKEQFGAMPVTSVTSEEISTYIAKRREEKASNATINREVATLKRMYKLAVITRRLKLGDQPYCPMLKERNVRKGFVTDADYASLALATGEIGLWMRTLFELAYSYGWRKSELLGLRVSQVDFMERTIVLHPGETKNDDARQVELTKTAEELLRVLIAGKGPEDYVFTRPARHGHGTLFRYPNSRFWWIQYYVEGKAKRESSKTECEEDARALLRMRLQALPAAPRHERISTFRKEWEDATKAAGCEGRLFHDLRRTGVRNLVRAGVTEKVAMRITGHKTRSVFERYNICSQEDIKDAVVKLNKFAETRRQRARFAEEYQGELPLQDPDMPPRKPVRSDRQSLTLGVENSARKPS